MVFESNTGNLKNHLIKSAAAKLLTNWNFNDGIELPLKTIYEKHVRFDETEEIIIIPGRSHRQILGAFCRNVAFALKTVFSVLCLPCIAIYKAAFHCLQKDSDDSHLSGQPNGTISHLPKANVS